MINIYLCEDEAVQLSYFERVIGTYIKDSGRAAKVVSARTSPEQTLADAKENKNRNAPSLFLIDIQLNGYSLDGFELARELKQQVKNGCLVFLTSREELAYKAFEYELGILDYIVKRPKDFLEDKVSDSIKRRLESIFDRIEENAEAGWLKWIRAALSLYSPLKESIRLKFTRKIRDSRRNRHYQRLRRNWGKIFSMLIKHVSLREIR